MASEFAALPTQLSRADEMDTSSQEPSYDAPIINGDHEVATDEMTQDENNTMSAPAEPAQVITETAIDTKVNAAPPPDPNPAGPTPIDDVASGIQPIADFIPKTASNLSHPTPPPDELLTTGAADIDTEMSNVEPEAQPEMESGVEPVAEADVQGASVPDPLLESSAAPPEQSLVRPREDDEEDERAAKRSKVEDDLPTEIEAADALDTVITDAPSAAPTEEVTTTVVESVTEPIGDVQVSEMVIREADGEADGEVEVEVEVTETMVAEQGGGVEVAEGRIMEDGDDVDVSETMVADPVSESVVEPAVETPGESSIADVKVEAPQGEAQPSNLPTQSAEPVEGTATITETPITETLVDEKPAIPESAVEEQPQPDATASASEKPTYSTAPMTTVQKSSLVDKFKNLKKTKSSAPFLKPVDAVALNIPTYYDVIKNPMDLGTMEGKLKEGQYKTLQEFVDDFDLIVSNTRRFNGDAHTVTLAAVNMEAYFRRMMQNVPTADMAAPAKVEKKRSPSITREKPPRRESRAAAASQSTAPPAETYALQPDGTPQIRRQSSNRPARAIKPPQNREIPYAKPKRKEHLVELKFCEHVFEEVRGPKHTQYNHVFQTPVDPVALNIPHYRSVIKHPMDLGTMGQKLRTGQYGTADEFRKDFELMVDNCLQFNPQGNPVRDLAIGLKREFDTLWATKDKWERKNQPPSNRASSASAEDESGAEDDEEDDDDDDDEKKSATIRALQKQLVEMQNQLSGALKSEKSTKSKKSKPSKAGTKKIGSVSAAPKSKTTVKAAPKPKKQRLVTYEEKQEISEAVGRMDEKQVGKLTEIITQNCAKYRDMDEMELEIDDLPNDVQLMLLDYVRRLFGNPKKKAREPSPDDAAALDDDDFEPEKGARGSKRKKHRPMGKQEQQDAIDNIKSRLAQFTQAATSGSESPANSSFAVNNAQADTSGDEESEESEEE